MTVKQLFDLCDEHSVEWYELKIQIVDSELNNGNPVNFDDLSKIKIDLKNETITLVI